ncbi:MAG: ABC transporter substrate-binding protein [Cellulosilyticaceae bacterium]
MRHTWRKIGVMGITAMLALTGCSQSPKIEEPIAIAALNGPTGMGIVSLIEDTEQYNITLYQSPDEIVGKVVSGEVDVACVPSNMASVLYNKTKGTDAEIGLLGVNTLGVLYLVENGDTITSIQDLKGKTVLASGKGSTPEFVFNKILEAAGLVVGQDVEIVYQANHADIASQLGAKEGTIALLPQPFVTTVLAKNSNVRVAVDLNEAWQEATQTALPMGTMIANKAYVAENKEEIDIFLKEYSDSVKFVNEDIDAASQLIAKHQIIPQAELAKKALPECHIVWIDSQSARGDLEAFYEVLKAAEPKSVGGQLPDEAFYNWR